MTRFIAALLAVAALTFTVLTMSAAAMSVRPNPHNFPIVPKTYHAGHIHPMPHNFPKPPSLAT